MTDPPKPRRKVTGQIAISSPSPSPSTSTAHVSSSSTTARVRAKVDVSSLPGPSVPTLARATTPSGRPTLRSTPSSASLRSGVSTTSSRARSPVPPLPSPPVSSVFGGRATPNTRPSLRTTASSSSSSHVTPIASTVRRAPTSGRSSPTKDVTPTARIRSSAVTQNAFGLGIRTPIRGTGLDVSGDGEGSGRRPTPTSRTSDADSATGGGGGKIRARVTQPATPITPGRFPPLLTPNGLEGHGLPSQTVPSSPLLSPPTFDPHPGGIGAGLQSPSFAQYAIMGQYQVHPTASAPGSPLHSATLLSLQRSASIKAKTRKPLPYNPATHPPSLPPAPLSPEMRTVDLPLMTPTRSRSREDDSRRPSWPGAREYSGAQVFLLDFDDRTEQAAFSGIPVANGGEEETTQIQAVNGDQAEEGKDRQEGEGEDEDDIPLETVEHVKEAKVNRKIADLEITNASLLAINRSLEATKSKQRSEIMKLRRMLRESLSGSKPGLTPIIPSYLSSTEPNDTPNGEGGAEEEDEEMHNPELDARWDRVAEMVDRLKVRGQTAVEKGKEEIKVAPGRVLDWTEVEGLNSSIASMAGTPEPERVGVIIEPGPTVD